MINLIMRYMYCGFAAIGIATVCFDVKRSDYICIFLATFFISLLLSLIDIKKEQS